MRRVSRRHQAPQSGHRLERDWSGANGTAVAATWIGVPIFAMIVGSVRPDFGFVGGLIVAVGLAVFITYEIVSS
jgi:uncharacterized membrane protein YkgB